MIKSVLTAAVLSAVLASGAFAATPAATATVAKKPVASMIHKMAMKKMTKMCKKGSKLVKGKCVVAKKM